MSDRADPSAPVVSRVDAVVFDVGRVLVQWDLRVLFAQVLDDPDEIAWVYAHAVTEAWHGQVDRGRALADMVAERRALFPQYAPVIEAYATRFPQSIPGPSLDGLRWLCGAETPSILGVGRHRVCLPCARVDKYARGVGRRSRDG